METIVIVAALFGVALATSAASTSVLIRVAPSIGALDHPGERKVHRSPVPRIGGIAVFLGFVMALVVAGRGSGMIDGAVAISMPYGAFAACAFAMFLMGLVDDLRGLSARSKFAVQVAVALTMWSSGFRIEVLSHPFGGDPVTLGWLSLPITLLWIVGITNAINLIDGLDGLAAGIALIVTTTVAVIAIYRGSPGILATSVALVGALAGFLVFNWNPARIFLGDSGSMFLGFVVAIIAIRGSQKGTTAVAVFGPLLILGLPIFDTSFAFLRRLTRVLALSRSTGGSRVGFVAIVRELHHVFLPDRGHVHHRLLDLGLSQRAAVFVLYGVGLVLAIATLAVVIMNSPFLALLLVVAMILAIAAFVAILVSRARRRERDSVGAVHTVLSSAGAADAEAGH